MIITFSKGKQIKSHLAIKKHLFAFLFKLETYKQMINVIHFLCFNTINILLREHNVYVG